MVIDDTKPLLEQRRFEAVGKINIKEIQFARKNIYVGYRYCGKEFNEVELSTHFLLPYTGPYFIRNEDYKALK
jgi:hypothetical protein